MPIDEVMFASSFQFPDKVISSIPISCNITLPINEDMLSWVKITPILISKGTEEICLADSTKTASWREYWEVYGDSELLWKGDLITSSGAWFCPYMGDLPGKNDYYYYPICWHKNDNNKYLWRAKYTQLGIPGLPAWSNYRLATWIGSPKVIYIPSIGGYLILFSFIWFRVKKTDSSIKEIFPCCCYNFYYAYSPAYQYHFNEDFAEGFLPSTLKVKRNIPDVEYYISGNNNYTTNLFKKFTKINNNKFNLSIDGTLYIKNKPILFNETIYPTLDNTYHRENYTDYYVYMGYVGMTFISVNTGIKYLLTSSSLDTITKKIPRPTNPTVNTRFLITIINPNNNEEIQRYEI